MEQLLKTLKFIPSRKGYLEERNCFTSSYQNWSP